MAIGTAVGNYQAEEAANKLLGNPTNYMNNIRQPGNPNSAVQNCKSQEQILNKDGRVTNYEMNQFGQRSTWLGFSSYVHWWRSKRNG